MKLIRSLLGLVAAAGSLWIGYHFGTPPKPKPELSLSGPDTAGTQSSEVRVFPELNNDNAAAFVAEARKHPAEALAKLNSLPFTDEQQDLAQQIVLDAFKTEPSLAGGLVAGLSEALARPMAAALVSEWTKLDARAAINWVTSLPDGEAKQEALHSLSADWAKLDPAAAADYALWSSPDGSRAPLLSVIGSHWAQSDSASAIEWSARMPEGDSKDAFLGAVSSSLAESHPFEAAKLVASLGPGPHQDDAALSVALQWARLDPREASLWVQSFPVPKLRLKTLSNMLSALTAEDPGAGQSVILALPDGLEKEFAISRYESELRDAHHSEATPVESVK